VLAARRLGADRILLLGCNPVRIDIARHFGATDIVTDRDEAAIAQIQEMTSGGAEAVLECVGSEGSMATSIGIARPGAESAWSVCPITVAVSMSSGCFAIM